MPSYDRRPKYLARYKCGACGVKFKKTLRDPDAPDPSCPDCGAPPAPVRGLDFDRPPPAAVGMNNAVRAIDATAEIVMQDYSMSNLRDATREGDTMAPKLDDPKKQAAADNFFTKGTQAAKENPQVAAHVAKMQTLATSGALHSQLDARFINNVIDSKKFAFRRTGSGKL